jgi:hypothetical protein
MSDQEPFNEAELFGGLNFDFSFLADLGQGLVELLKDGKTITPLVSNRCYHDLHIALQAEVTDINCALDVPVYDMTGLEYSVYEGDWKMASIFFANGADAMKNAFNGTVQTQASYSGFGSPITLASFAHLDGETTIPGFDGLRALAMDGNENPDVMLAFLWLMEICSSSYALDLRGEFPRILTSLCLVCPPDNNIGDRLKAKIHQVSLICLRMGLDSTRSLEIIQRVVIDFIWTIFTEEKIVETIAEEQAQQQGDQV